MADLDLRLKQYELGLAYLTAHLGRMWTRFNFFVTVQSGLVTGLVFTRDGGGFTNAALYFAIALAALSLVWWVFGAQDRYLVEAYRGRVRDEWRALAGDDGYVGNPEGADIRQGPFQWRSDAFSVTRLAAIVPALLALWWVAAAVLLAVRG